MKFVILVLFFILSELSFASSLIGNNEYTIYEEIKIKKTNPNVFSFLHLSNFLYNKKNYQIQTCALDILIGIGKTISLTNKIILDNFESENSTSTSTSYHLTEIFNISGNAHNWKLNSSDASQNIKIIGTISISSKYEGCKYNRTKCTKKTYSAKFSLGNIEADFVQSTLNGFIFKTKNDRYFELLKENNNCDSVRKFKTNQEK